MAEFLKLDNVVAVVGSHGFLVADKSAPQPVKAGIMSVDQLVAHASESLGKLSLEEQTSEPPNPADRFVVVWLSNGTGNGNAGDLMAKITQGAETRLFTLLLYSSGIIL